MTINRWWLTIKYRGLFYYGSPILSKYFPLEGKTFTLTWVIRDPIVPSVGIFFAHTSLHLHLQLSLIVPVILETMLGVQHAKPHMCNGPSFLATNHSATEVTTTVVVQQWDDQPWTTSNEISDSRNLGAGHSSWAGNPRPQRLGAPNGRRELTPWISACAFQSVDRAKPKVETGFGFGNTSSGNTSHIRSLRGTLRTLSTLRW